MALKTYHIRLYTERSSFTLILDAESMSDAHSRALEDYPDHRIASTHEREFRPMRTTYSRPIEPPIDEDEENRLSSARQREAWQDSNIFRGK